MALIGAMDIGSLTVRCLIAEGGDKETGFVPLLRIRRYIKVAEEYGSEDGSIAEDGITKTLEVMDELSKVFNEYGVEKIDAVATGIWRKAKNASEIIDRIYRGTGISVRVISSKEEAKLTATGVINSMEDEAGSFIIFDLGGASTEFIHVSQKEVIWTHSIEIGAGVLTKMFVNTDPPDPQTLSSIKEYIRESLNEISELNFKNDIRHIGTGGTVTSISAMLYGIDTGEISPERINGLIVRYNDLYQLYKRVAILSRKERLRLKGLDEGRADFIVAGMKCVLEIMGYLKADSIIVSLSDILEGLIISNIR